jgi:hypothetical protein
LAPSEFVFVVFAIDAEADYLLDGKADPCRSQRGSGLKLLSQERFADAAVPVEPGDDAVGYPLRDDPAPRWGIFSDKYCWADYPRFCPGLRSSMVPFNDV